MAASIFSYLLFLLLFLFFLLGLSPSSTPATMSCPPTPHISGTSYLMISLIMGNDEKGLACISSMVSQSVANSLCVPFRYGDCTSASFYLIHLLNPSNRVSMPFNLPLISHCTHGLIPLSIFFTFFSTVLNIFSNSFKNVCNTKAEPERAGLAVNGIATGDGIRV